jgi:hypothetical protein
MPVTLAQAQVNVQDALQSLVIDEFRKSSFLMDKLTFDDCVSPTGGGSTMTYGYTRVITQPTAAFRAINAEYLPQEAAKQRFTADLKVFGGSFQLDRVINNMGGIVKEASFQMQQKIKAASALFNDTVINGDNAIDINAFDGLDKAVTGSSTELVPGAAISLDTTANITANYVAFLDVLDEFLMGLDGTPDFIGGNTKLIAKIRACARRAGMYQVTKNDFGQQIESYGVIPLVDFGAKPGSNNPVVPIDIVTGETSLYTARLGLDGFHAISMAGVAPVQSWLPDYKTAGAVKTGEVEMVAAVALKATKAAGILRRIKVQ